MTDEQKTKLTEIISGLQMEPMISAEERAKREAVQRQQVVEKMREFLDEKQVARAKQLVLHFFGLQALTDEEVVTALSLTPEQQEQIAGILAGQREQRAKIDAQMQSQEVDFREARDLIVTLREETDAELLTVLTEEQKKAWETLLGPAPAEPERGARPQRAE